MNKPFFGATIRVNNVNEALMQGILTVQQHGEPAESRGMPTCRVPGPVLTVYENPCDRVLFDPIRDANPFFHLMEAMWLLSGSNKVNLPKAFMGNIDRFSDNGTTFHGAYGHRLHSAFGFDQINRAVAMLKGCSDTRQVVLSIWNPATDLGFQTKDMPCNDMLMLDIVDGALNMTVCNRSNDVVWGAYGANAVQFSVLQEYIALLVNVPVGRYVQMSNNYHIYEDNIFWQAFKEGGYPPARDPYANRTVSAYPLGISPRDTAQLGYDCVDLANLVEAGQDMRDMVFHSSFGNDVLQHVINGYTLYKMKMYLSSVESLRHVKATDWRMAMIEWVQRRMRRASDKGAQA